MQERELVCVQDNNEVWRLGLLACVYIYVAITRIDPNAPSSGQSLLSSYSLFVCKLTHHLQAPRTLPTLRLSPPKAPSCVYVRTRVYIYIYIMCAHVRSVSWPSQVSAELVKVGKAFFDATSAP